MARTKDAKEQKVVRSQEYVDDSSSNSDSGHAVRNGSQREKSGTSSQSRLGDEAEAQSSVQSDSDASAASSGSERSAARKKRSEPPVPAKEPTRKKPKTHVANELSIKRYSYKPPIGYQSVELDATDFVLQSAKMFSHLHGKQVWHITAPASVPLATIEQLDIPAALRGEPILHHKGISYNMFTASPKQETLLVRQGADSTYSRVKVDVSRNFHLRELPPHTTTTDAVASPRASTGIKANGDASNMDNPQFFASQEGSKKPRREQPLGLLMRYQPYGGAPTSGRPYRLSNPGIDEIEEDRDSTANNLVVPSASSDDESRSLVKTPKKSKHGRRSKHDTISHDTNVVREDAMEIDTNLNGGSQNTPSSKARGSGSKAESREKRTKHHKVKA